MDASGAAQSRIMGHGVAALDETPTIWEERVAYVLERLVDRKLISTGERKSIGDLVLSTGEPLDRTLCGLLLAEERDLADAFAGIFGFDRFEAQETDGVEFARLLSPQFLLSARVFPVSENEAGIRVALADPTDLLGLKGCEFALQRSIIPVIATSSELDALFARLSTNEDAVNDGDGADLASDDAERLKDLASAEPAVKKCNSLVSDAVKARASDIHIEPDERAFRVRFRVDGALIERDSLSVRQGLAVISRFKILSNLDIAERRRPQDGRFTFPVAGRAVDLRLSVTPNVYGEGAVLRLLQRDEIALDLSALGFSEEAAARLHRLTDRPNGILLLTGPTGSGKTTTLYALLRRLARRDVKILTIEDPVEYRIDGISQCQVNPAIGLTFASALRSFLRHDPDIMMVGEMRDLETARTAVQAALTGHLVLSTLHTNDAPSAVTRLLDMGVEDYLIASTLIGVVAQRLLRRTCNKCDGAGRISDAVEGVCPRCAGSGFYGRIAVTEILESDDALRAGVKDRKTAAELAQIARGAGFVTMREDGEAKIAAGVTTSAELLKAIAE
ncbi:MAG TPA: type II secretion system protein GspE [Parvularcula sp.]|nr:type II secretion system protein GspE [Parvularcula sp.]HBS36002.1 type II secretion system protein GspE [Parvularcula sp.]